MSRKMLITLIVLMVFVITGLITVQTKMIKTASDIREEQFDQLVQNALYRVSLQLNQREEFVARVNAMNNRLPSTNSENSDFNNVFPRNSPGSSSISFGLSYSENGVLGSFQEDFQLNLSDTVNMNNTESDKDPFLSGIDGILELSRELNRRREKSLNDIFWYRNYKLLLEERPIQDRIEPDFLEKELADAIAQTNIDLDYKYAIKNSNLGKDKIIFGDNDYNPGSRKEYPQLLFQTDFSGSKPNYLYIYFPKRWGYLLRETGVTIIPTIILTAFLPT